MTPLAHRIVKELTLPKKDRTFDDKGDLLRRMSDIHCFECTQVLPTAIELANNQFQSGQEMIVKQACLAFLPAPRTWLEWHSGKQRNGILLEDGGDFADATIASDVFRSIHIGQLTLKNSIEEHGGGYLVLSKKTEAELLKEVLQRFILGGSVLIFAFLALINTPRIICRKQHMPHAGLQRKLAAKMGGVGKFPLHAWTEIQLKIEPPVVDENTMHETRLTGTKALHFVRAHLRIRFGKLELVSAHWRGDGSLGIKQSRYKLVQ